MIHIRGLHDELWACCRDLLAFLYRVFLSSWCPTIESAATENDSNRSKLPNKLTTIIGLIILASMQICW